MQTLYLEKGSSNRLIAVFLGWAMDYRPFASLHRPGYDVVLIWDYSTPDFNYATWEAYDEIIVIGWSMGVYFSTLLPPHIESKVTCRIAVNGTLTPMDDNTGIPESIFMGTLVGLNERNLEKFYMRVCGDRATYNEFKSHRPTRNLDQLRNELASMTALPSSTARFDIAVISEGDAIFPPRNQERAWKDTLIEILPGPHLPDLQFILDRYVMDKDMIIQRFSSGATTYESEAIVQEELVDRLFEAIGDAKNKDVLEVGCGTGLLSRKIANRNPHSFEMWDICDVNPFEGANIRIVDAEMAVKNLAPDSLDVIATASAIQWFNSPANFLINAAHALRAGGVLAIGTYVKGNLDEITSLMPISLPLMSETEWRKIVPESLEIVYTNNWSRVVKFENALDTFRHLKLTGVNSLGRNSTGAVSLREIMSRYGCADDGKWHLTYRPLILILKKKV